VRELGSGACGKTVLLLDDLIDEYFVCKKFSPSSENLRTELFENFIREIKLLHKLHHENVVRVFNYYLYPDQFTGYILMEFVDGVDVSDYIANNPEQANSLFVQAISGFAYLESQGILHRDIRQTNVLVRTDGTVKVIDLGFGKRIQNSQDFDKSISLNWWCETPAEFADSRYDFTSEVYFVGKLFEKLIADHGISHFKHLSALGRMCQHDPKSRTASFADVEREIRNKQFADIEFSDSERAVYRAFADAICQQISKIESGVKYVDDLNRIVRQLDEAYRKFMLETYAPDSAPVIRCLIDGNYYYYKNVLLPVDCVRDFTRLLKSATEEKRRLILANLHTRLDCLPRYTPAVVSDDDIPF
jgi:eukaryotic-like serine/threonine-protein kinase